MESKKSIALADEILKALTRQKIDVSSKELTVFIQTFIKQIPDEDIQRLKHDGLTRLGYSLWNFIQNRQPNKPKYRVYHLIPDTNSTVSNRLVVEVMTPSVPFLVSSLSGLIERQNLKPQIFIHSAFQIERSLEGCLKKIAPPDYTQKRDVNKNYETLTHFQIRGHYDADVIKRIRTMIPKVLSQINLATQDWQAMQHKLPVLIQNHIIDEEKRLFLQWLADHRFVFLGYAAYNYMHKTKFVPQGMLGLMKDETLQDFFTLFQGSCMASVEQCLMQKENLLINKSSQISHIHRPVHMDVIGIKERCSKIHIFTGLFTAEAYNSTVHDIPFLRLKVSQVMKKVGYSKDWHDGKALGHILDSLPRDELFQASVDTLATVSQKILSIQSRRRVALFVRKDSFCRFLSCFVYVPKDRFDSHLSEKMRLILEKGFGYDASLVRFEFGGELSFARIQYQVQLPHNKAETHVDITKIEKQLILASESWQDQLFRSYDLDYSEEQLTSLMQHYGEAFNHAYRDAFTIEQVRKDIDDIEKILGTDKLRAKIYFPEESRRDYINLKLFSDKKPVHLSHILPTLKNMGMHVISEVPYQIQPQHTKHSVWLHDFMMSPIKKETVLSEDMKENFLNTLIHIWSKTIENDPVNSLVIYADLSWRECMLIRAYSNYLHQLRTPYGRYFIQKVLSQHGSFVKILTRLFQVKFDPQRENHDTQDLLRDVEGYLNAVSSAEEDKALRLFLSLIDATVRTNYFQPNRTYISFKFDCTKIDMMPLPRPMYEIFVYSPKMAGVHLRAGNVARGGLRWSDRHQDFRTEILGLMKSQIVKNTVIVPTGSKGGFVVKSNLQNLSREACQKEVVSCYQIFIRGLLDLTDNMCGDKIVPPQYVVCHDDPDPYLVVAADKGTATFSDFANAVSRDYNFWLGDAFASGGSVGYDHKKMGITARGAWASVQHHFYGMGIDPQKDPITVVGVGDMSGDVFGNGMLLSKTLKVVAAFNHVHIFVDPDPDAAKSYQERLRLFHLPRSSWKDYDPHLISEGGGVFARSEKSILLSSQMQSLLKVKVSKLTPTALIHKLLQLPVDLLWFGGIGTYVKGKQQSHSDVGDKANDEVRVDGHMLRCRVVGEGANLAFTQDARIEFAHRGGQINTDFIDNSAGVDTSDHEVNLKILFGRLIHQKKIDEKKRNMLLIKMSDDIADLVLQDNRKQNFAISMIEARGSQLIDAQSTFIRAIEEEGILDRQLEKLPDDGTLRDYSQTQRGFRRPEIAVLLSYAKLSLERNVLQTDLIQDPYFDSTVMGYFPKVLQKSYSNEILTHPLRKELVATYLVNEVVNRMGAAFVHDTQKKTSRSVEEICRAYFVIHALLDLPAIWSKLMAYTTSIPREIILQNYHLVWRVIQRMVFWWLKSPHTSQPIADIVRIFSKGFKELNNKLNHCIYAYHQEIILEKTQKLQDLGFEKVFADKLSTLTLVIFFPEIVELASRTQFQELDTARVYFKVGDVFGCHWLRDCIDSIRTTNKWHRLALNMLIEDFDQCQSALTEKIILFGKQHKGKKKVEESIMSDWCHQHHELVSCVTDHIAKAQTIGGVDLAFLTVVAREMRQLIKLT